MKLFLTGDPGCGKTTAVLRVVEALRGRVAMSGFVTEEMLVDGRRAGFRGRTLDGAVFELARAGRASPFQLGPYGVVLEGLEAIGIPSIAPREGVGLIVLDEIGKMESFSNPFREAVERLLASDLPVVGTVASHGVGFPKKVRHDSRVTLVRMNRSSRAWAVGEILRKLGPEVGR